MRRVLSDTNKSIGLLSYFIGTLFYYLPRRCINFHEIDFTIIRIPRDMPYRGT